MTAMREAFIQPAGLRTLRSPCKYKRYNELRRTTREMDCTPLLRGTGRVLRMNTNTNKGRDDKSFQQLALEIKEYLKTCPANERNPLAYTTLRRAGRLDLISRIMDAGGYINVAQALGVRVDQSQFIPAPRKSTEWDKPSSGADIDSGASLAVGRDLEERLSTIADVMKNETPREDSISSTPSVRKSDDVPTGEQLRLQNDSIVPPIVDEPSPADERLTLTLATRIGMLSLAVINAIGYGRSSYDIIPYDNMIVCRVLAGGLLFTHILLGVYAGVTLAPQKRRNPALWFAKVCLGGPFEIRYLRGLDVLPD